MLERVKSRLPDTQEDIVFRVIGCAIEVHRHLGPGFKERIYVEALCLELNSAGLSFERERPIAVTYKSWSIPGQRIDLTIEGVVLAEVKAVSRLKSIHRSQVISYLRTTGLPVGLLMNFNSRRLKDSMDRIVL
jgi:GxxExxY protein